MEELPSKDKYLVFKYHDLNKISLTIKEHNLLDNIIVRINEYRDKTNLGKFQCVVVEPELKCYEIIRELVKEEARTKVPKQAFLLATAHSDLKNYYYNYDIAVATSASDALASYVDGTINTKAEIIAVKEGNNFKILDKTIPVPFEWLEELTQTELD